MTATLVALSASVQTRAGLKFSPTAWKTSNYRGFIETLSAWATAMDVEPTDVEECLFRADATGQWAA